MTCRREETETEKREIDKDSKLCYIYVLRCPLNKNGVLLTVRGSIALTGNGI